MPHVVFAFLGSTAEEHLRPARRPATRRGAARDLPPFLPFPPARAISNLQKRQALHSCMGDARQDEVCLARPGLFPQGPTPRPPARLRHVKLRGRQPAPGRPPGPASPSPPRGPRGRGSAPSDGPPPRIERLSPSSCPDAEESPHRASSNQVSFDMAVARRPPLVARCPLTAARRPRPPPSPPVGRTVSRPVGHRCRALGRRLGSFGDRIRESRTAVIVTTRGRRQETK